MKQNKISSNHIKQLAFDFRTIAKEAPSKQEALQSIVAYAKSQIGDFFRPEILLVPNELSILFMELLDQILFELNETISGDNNIKDYIIDDLFLRLSIYMDLHEGIDIYKKNLANRSLTFEDTIIIRNYHLNEFTPLLVAEYNEQPSLQKWILRTLLSFDSEDLHSFYYAICSEKNCLDVKLLAFVGLKSYHTALTNWDSISPDVEIPWSLLVYIRSFDTINLANNTAPYDIKSLIFVLIFIEHNIEKLPSFEWLLASFKPLFDFPVESNLPVNLYLSITQIILNCNPDTLSCLSDDSRQMKLFLQIIDLLPRDYFDKISLKISSLENNFITTARSLVNSNQVRTDDFNSNLISFFLAEKINI